MEKSLKIKKIEKKEVSGENGTTIVHKAILDNDKGDKMTIEQTDFFYGWKPNQYIEITLVNEQTALSTFDKELNKLKAAENKSTAEKVVNFIEKAVEKRKLKKPYNSRDAEKNAEIIIERTKKKVIKAKLKK
jgi:hypothetical protein